uniref:WRKY19-like zinc finger domain-containing protein n=1 Tax=Hyaloperonospora arabidopsidis (strain Emoy2) TaxID=559515 RepID=M4BB60_HYAAE
MTISQAPFTGPASNLHPFMAPAHSTPCSQQSMTDYPPLALFTAAECVQNQDLRRQQQEEAATHLQQPVTPTLHLTINPKLPSLAGLLKQMQATTPVASMASPQHPQLSPVSRGPTPIPSLRSAISPSMVKRTPPVTSMSQMPLPSVALFSLPSNWKVRSSSMGPSFPSKRRSWADASPADTIVCPSKSRTSFSSQHTHRNRASKYCKIEGCERVSQRNNLCHSHGGKRLCKEEGCSSKDRGNGFCIKHGGGKICSMAGCEKKARRKGLCTEHFRISDES